MPEKPLLYSFPSGLVELKKAGGLVVQLAVSGWLQGLKDRFSICKDDNFLVDVDFLGKGSSCFCFCFVVGTISYWWYGMLSDGSVQPFYGVSAASIFCGFCCWAILIYPNPFVLCIECVDKIDLAFWLRLSGVSDALVDTSSIESLISDWGWSFHRVCGLHLQRFSFYFGQWQLIWKFLCLIYIAISPF